MQTMQFNNEDRFLSPTNNSSSESFQQSSNIDEWNLKNLIKYLATMQGVSFQRPWNNKELPLFLYYSASVILASKFHDKKTYISRRATFDANNMPYSSADNLAKWGLFRSQSNRNNNRLTCFHCGINVDGGWDRQEESLALEEHKRLRPQCAFLCLMKLFDFNKSYYEKWAQSLYAIVASHLNQMKLINDIVENPQCTQKAVITVRDELDLSRDAIAFALWIPYLEKWSVSKTNVDNWRLEEEENNSSGGVGSSGSGDSSTSLDDDIENHPLFKNIDKLIDNCLLIITTLDEFPLGLLNSLMTEIRQYFLKETFEIKKPNTSCQKCKKPADYLFFPCQHLAICHDCKEKMERRSLIVKCPRCQMPVYDVVRIYRSS